MPLVEVYERHGFSYLRSVGLRGCHADQVPGLRRPRSAIGESDGAGPVGTPTRSNVGKPDSNCATGSWSKVGASAVIRSAHCIEEVINQQAARDGDSGNGEACPGS